MPTNDASALRMTAFTYFAYGSNMSVARLRQRTPSAAVIGAASLKGHRLVFDKASKDGSGKADCERTEAEGDVVYGGLFRINQSELGDLDKAEGRGAGYERVSVTVATPEGDFEAVTYLATKKQPGLKPYSWYVEHVVFGARALNLPLDYIERIRLVQTLEDPDIERAQRELSIYKDAHGKH